MVIEELVGCWECGERIEWVRRVEELACDEYVCRDGHAQRLFDEPQNWLDIRLGTMLDIVSALPNLGGVQ